jgi:hypothetical protein
MRGADGEVLLKIAENVIAAFPRTGGGRQHEKGELTACLNRAWGTELILASGIGRFNNDDGFLRIANAWGCVQAYYVGYSAAQALVVASGNPRPKNHPKTQDQSITLWTNVRNGVVPFSFAATQGSVLNKDPMAYAHGPGRKILVSIHSWTSCTKRNAWDIAALALRTTREQEVEKKLEEARKSKIKQKVKNWQATEVKRVEKGMAPRSAPTYTTAQLSRAEKDDCEKAVRPHGLLDYLFRLRIKANYEDAEMFTEGPEDGSSSIIAATNMVRIATATMIAHETRIAQLLGRDAVLDLARAWIEKNAPPDSMGVGQRLPILEDVLP